ncbi:CsbD family protein [Nitratidesulfovibrio sp.]|uniref:CsbD family protein n=1 Tax=Nitratidesulfovibrio sp. TaxID=2802297 RepID=UPI003341F42B
MSLPGMDEIKAKWQQQIGAAKVAWGELTDDELLQSEGHAQKLAGLVQERYAISREEAEKQVQRFLDKNSTK